MNREEFARDIKDRIIPNLIKLQNRKEANIKKGVIEPILMKLNWDVFNQDEVYDEFPIGEGSVDYALFVKKHPFRGKLKPMVLVEAKNAGQNLERHEDQLLKYCFKEGIKIGILTNGDEWWFYLPCEMDKTFEQRKFNVIKLSEQKPDESADRFIEFLSKENIESGIAIKNAKSMFDRFVDDEILCEIWNRIIQEPNEMLLDLMIEEIAEAKGITNTEKEIVEAFLQSHADKFIINSEFRDKYKSSNIKIKNDLNKATFLGKKLAANKWIDVLLALCNILAEKHKKDFSTKVLDIRGKNRPYFTKHKDELRRYAQIKGTDLFVEKNFSANSIKKLCYQLIAIFGYAEKTLVFDEGKH